LNFEEKVRFGKGNTIPKGKRKRTQIGKLTANLKKEKGYLVKSGINIMRQGINIMRQGLSVRLI
jgi:hypothetical protein